LTTANGFSIFTYVENKIRGNNMINNTNRFNLSTYETEYTKFCNDRTECKELAFSIIRKLYNLSWEKREELHSQFEVLHTEHWVAPALSICNEMFNMKMETNVKHVTDAGLEYLTALLTIPPKTDEDKLVILEFAEKLQSHIADYKTVMTNFLNNI
jgi:predicted adenine nucleotide alpha hydrolase (AANH) superfamily ATPase